MKIEVQRAEYRDVEAMRGLFRQEANCQIVHDSMLSRGLADAYLILVDEQLAGYGAVLNKYDKDRLSEFYTLPQQRGNVLPMFRELLAVSRATSMEAQTNIPCMLTLLYDCAEDIVDEKILFHDAFTSNLVCPQDTFRQAVPADAASIFPHQHEPVGEWVVESQSDGAILATGGFLCHYNPPYGDIYMEVSEAARLQGIGSFLVQELKRVCYEAGKKPAARCDTANIASRRTLQRAGLLPCGRFLTGNIRSS